MQPMVPWMLLAVAGSLAASASPTEPCAQLSRAALRDGPILIDEGAAGDRRYLLCGQPLGRAQRNDVVLVYGTDHRLLDVGVVSTPKRGRGREWVRVSGWKPLGELPRDGLRAELYDPELHGDWGKGVQLGPDIGMISQVGDDLAWINLGRAQGVQPCDRYRVFGTGLLTGSYGVHHDGFQDIATVEVVSVDTHRPNSSPVRPIRDPRLVEQLGLDGPADLSSVRPGMVVRRYGRCPAASPLQGRRRCGRSAWSPWAAG